jgi:dihydrofolate reductase
MKTTLWATLTANGNYARSTAAHPPKPQALADFAAQVAAHGNFIVGRRTFQDFQAQPQRSDGGAANVFASADIVVVSRSLTVPGLNVASTPEAALAQLRARGHQHALIAGGEQLHNACLAAGIVDELIVNIAPGLEDAGLKLQLPQGQYRELVLLGSGDLGGGVFRLRYAISGAGGQG